MKVVPSSLLAFQCEASFVARILCATCTRFLVDAKSSRTPCGPLGLNSQLLWSTACFQKDLPPCPASAVNPVPRMPAISQIFPCCRSANSPFQVISFCPTWKRTCFSVWALILKTKRVLLHSLLASCSLELQCIALSYLRARSRRF